MESKQQVNKQNKTERDSETENKLVVIRVEGGGGMGEIAEGD